MNWQPWILAATAVVSIGAAAGALLYQWWQGRADRHAKAACEAQLPNPVDGGYITLNVDRDRITVVRIENKLWWQFWRPQKVRRVLGWVSHQTRAHDCVALICEPVEHRLVYTVTVNTTPILRVT